MRILVAGGAGFVGSHLVDTLLLDGHVVTVADNFVTGRHGNLNDAHSDPGLRIVEMDVTDRDSIEKLRGPYDCVYHLASPASPVGFARYPIETLMVNAVGTRNLLEIARRDDARFLFTSTSEVYGEPLEHPQSEEYRGNVSTTGPRSCYDEGKRFAESLSMNYLTSHGVDVRIARLFNTYGPRIAPDDGRVVSNFLIQALMGNPITVYGDGTQTRSLCYVGDTVRALIDLMERDVATGQVVNIGNPDEYTILEISREIIELTGSTSPIIFEPLPVDDPTRRRPDISRARELLQWEPRWSLREGLSVTLVHYRQILDAVPQ